MDDNFFSGPFINMHCKMTAINYKIVQNMELTEKDKVFCQVLEKAIPIINKLCDEPNMNLESALGKDENKENDIKTENDDVNVKKHETINQKPNTMRFNRVESSDDSLESYKHNEYNYQDEETKRILNDYAIKELSYLHKLRDEIRWVSIISDDLDNEIKMDTFNEVSSESYTIESTTSEEEIDISSLSTNRIPEVVVSGSSF